MPSADLASGIISMPTYSHSKLETFQNCPMRYKLQYIDKVEVEEFESIEAFMGSLVHETLEKLYQDVQMTKIPTPEELVQFFDDQWEDKWHDGVKVVKKAYTADHYREIGRKCVADYYAEHYPFDQARTIALEHLVFFPLDDDEHYWIRGIIDRISVTRDGIYEIHDYKTSSRLMTQGAADRDRQLALYQIGLGRMWKDAGDVDLVWHYLAFGREIRSRRTPEELESLRGDIMGLISRIESERNFYPKETPLCNWCAYTEHCPAKSPVKLTAGTAANEYLRQDGSELVNRFADLSRRKGEVEEEMAKVREALVEHARANRIQTIRGDKHKVFVRVYRGYSFPGRDEPERRELEKIVKEAGLWDRVAVLSPVSLAKLVESGKIDGKVAEAIKALGEETERPWLKLSNL
jgi:putative RecB family exonuclease